MTEAEAIAAYELRCRRRESYSGSSSRPSASTDHHHGLNVDAAGFIPAGSELNAVRTNNASDIVQVISH